MEFLFKLINFLIFAGIIFYFARKPFSGFLRTRSETIDGNISNIKQAHNNVKIEEKNWNNKLANIETEIGQLKTELENNAEFERNKMIDSAKKYAEQLKSDASLYTRYETEHAISEIKQFATRSAFEIVIKRVAKEITSDEHVRIVEKLTAQLNYNL